MNPSSGQDARDHSAERFLHLAQGKRQGTLRIYLGLAACVGKTYRLLQEAHVLHAHGVDVLIGYVETHGRADTGAELRDVPLLPRKKPQLNDKQLHLDLQRPPNLPAARADVEKATWALINLLANAIRYSPVGETLTVQELCPGPSCR